MVDIPTKREDLTAAGEHLCDTIVEAIKGMGPLGAPAGPMYAAFMCFGCSLETFENFMAMLVNDGRLRKSGHLYFAVEK